jgi:two-component system cell cycle sensor histidine kinase/response regulator CckA
MPDRLRVLIIDTSEVDAKLVVEELRRTNRTIEAEQIRGSSDLAKALERGSVDIVICDWSGPELSAARALSMVRELGEELPFIVVSGSSSEEEAVEAMRRGAQDFVLKQRIGRLAPIVERELRERDRRRALQADRARAEEALKQSESQLRHAQKMEAVGRLAGGIAHEFNNALSVILSYGELMLGDLEPGDPMRADVEEMRKAAKRAADLTRQLLVFNRQHIFETKDIDVVELLGGMEKMLRRVLGEDVALSMTVAPSLGTVRADPRSLEQAVMNLVVNARDAMPRGGKVAIVACPLEVDASFASAHLGLQPGPHVLVSVADTGIGMGPETLARVFEPFFTTKEQGKGTGLGLSTVFGIVKQTGGSVWAESSLGMGATNKLCLPRAAPASADPPAPSTGKETILVVEDEPQVRAVAADILQRYGYRVLEAKNAAEADRLCRDHSGTIDLLLSDVVMPDANGPELAVRLQTLRPNMRLLCMSGYADDATAGRASVPPFIAYFQKPLTPETLARKVRDVLDAPLPRAETSQRLHAE